MNHFVNLKTVFSKESERDIEKFTRIYSDKGFLQSVIGELVHPYLPDEVIKNKRILLKPNWVLHNRKQTDEICMRTDDNFLLSALEVILKKKPSTVTIGDAPVQGANWNQIVKEPFKKAISSLSDNYQVPIIIKDFRRVTFNPALNNLVQERNSLSNYIIFDLGKKSYLEPISDSKRKLFRVTNYNPDRLAESHGPGVHKYCITKDLFENDIVITVPKLKTHQKAGITNALKILVGVNGDKDYLPHHRSGGTGNGGDCYPGNNLLRKWAEHLLDQANRVRGESRYKIWMRLSMLLWRLSLPTPYHTLEAAWYGNDTTWRMVLDLNKIAEYGKLDGSIDTTSQRKIFSLTDGIIGGQGNGPLQPDPIAFGVVAFSNNSSLTDIIMGKLMGFDVMKIPLLKTSFENLEKIEVDFLINDKVSRYEDIERLVIKTIPPPGWINYLS